MTEPKKGDRVRVTYEALYHEPVNYPGAAAHFVKLDDQYTASVPAGAEFEIIERADDPSKDPLGTVRRNEDLIVVRDKDDAVYPWVAIGPGGRLSDGQVTGWEKLAPVAGTRAAEPAYRYFKDTSRERPAWRVCPDGYVQYRGISTWRPSKRYNTLADLLADSALHEVPAP